MVEPTPLHRGIGLAADGQDLPPRAREQFVPLHSEFIRAARFFAGSFTAQGAADQVAHHMARIVELAFTIQEQCTYGPCVSPHMARRAAALKVAGDRIVQDDAGGRDQ